MRRICAIYKSPKKDEMYLYVDKKEGLERVPETLLEHFGKPIDVMTMLVSSDKPLARADSAKVLAEIEEKGFYLQMPPSKEPYMLDLYRTPTDSRY